ncbi:PTS system, galactitol-specific IIB component [Schleiferilactobacillus shenzhenensis LY-73]|uniref:PTS system, galactitol-specific IIB component n=1 Tax=Schleiferilactobacillus shenzhenensis LY-73 TaxID=1231336 RepID=U4TJC0_9LACO|nr:PTS system, galactitol-specific IIB component [Schleiferilactobacillus shenzhenensis LY-73]
MTSTIAIQKLQEELDKRGVPKDEYKIDQASIPEVPSMADNYDLVITTTQYTNPNGKPVTNGLPFLTNIGLDQTMDEIIKHLDLKPTK